MADLDNLEYYIKFPSPGFNYAAATESDDYVFVVDETKLPVILLFGWAGCQDKYLSKYSQIYEEKGLITLRYTAPVKCLFWKRLQMRSIGERIVKLLVDLNFESHPVIVHCFSNGGAFLYQNFSLALEKSPKPIQVKGVIFDSAPGRRRISRLYRAISVILGGGFLYNFPVSVLMTVFISMIWFYEVVKSYVFPKNAFQSDPLQTLKNEKHLWPQLFLYSQADDLIPHTDIEYFAEYRKKLGVDVTSVCFGNTPHVKHYIFRKETYVNAIFSFINKCLNGSDQGGL